MRIPARFAPILFSALLSAIMVCIVSAFVLAISRGGGLRIPCAVAQKLYYDMAGSLSNRRHCGSLGTTNSRPSNRLKQVLSHKKPLHQIRGGLTPCSAARAFGASAGAVC